MGNKTIFDNYLAEINKAYLRGDATEHTHRSALQSLIEAIDSKITATNEPKRIKCGAPDYVITRKKRNLVETIGYIEAKDIGINLTQTAKTEQIKKRYLPSLNNFILTDYIEFRWYVGAELRLTATLATEQADGSFKADDKSIETVSTLFQSFLSQESEKITSSKDLASRMASMARLLRGLIENTFDKENKQGSLHNQFEAFKKVLLHDLKEEQFADMYAQTICYGLFAARCYIEDANIFGKDKLAVFHGHDNKPGKFTREHAGWLLPKTNPFLQKMFNEIAGPGLPDEISWLVDDLVATLKNCRMDSVLKGFAKQSHRKDPVIHFYETFLAAYDAKMREQRGVYYTPEPVVSYIVRSVDWVLKEKFGLKRGLADDSKIKIPVKRRSKKDKTKEVEETRQIHKLLILDPATGTGTFLHETIEQIYKKFRNNKGKWAGYVKKHLLPRIYGFELMMAPYTIAHMKLSLQLAEKGYDFGSDERLKIFLTNTLEEAEEMSNQASFTQWLAEEARQANDAKRDLPIMVVMGNPPYSGLSANMNDWTEKLLKQKLPGKNGAQSYYELDGQPLGEKKVWLQDDYVKFIRFAQYRIEQTGYGVLAFITNHGYLDNPTFRGMRQSLMTTFDEIYLLDLHGNAKKKETAPDGSKDVNVFDIQQGVSIGIFVKQTTDTIPAKIYHQDLFGLRKDKYQWLETEDIKTTKWNNIKPNSPYYFFVPKDETSRAEYDKYPSITEIMPINVTGIVTARDSIVIDVDSNDLKNRIKEFRDKEKTDDEIRNKYFPNKSSGKYLKGDTRGWKLSEARRTLRNDKEWGSKFSKILYRPFDPRDIYYAKSMVDWPRKELMQHMLAGENLGLIFMRQVSLNDDYNHFLITPHIVDNRAFYSNKGIMSQAPLYLYGDLFGSGDKKSGKGGRVANLSDKFIAEFAAAVKMEYIPDGKGDLKTTFGPEDVLAYIYAVFHSTAYRKKYAEFLKIDFPRVPLPDGKVMFRKFAQTGSELMALHLLESDILDDEKLQPSYPIEDSDTVELGYPKYIAHADKPEKGRVYINKAQYFEGVLPQVWDFRIGGYQVCEKWLKDRRNRQLSVDDITHYQKIIVSIGRTIKLMAQEFLNEPWV